MSAPSRCPSSQDHAGQGAENRWRLPLRALWLGLGLWLAVAPSPSRGAEGPTVPRPAQFVTREQWGSTPQPIPAERKQTPKCITLHHAGVDFQPGTDPVQFVKSMQSWGQREKHWPDLPYHFLIAPDGRIFEARSMDYEPESNTTYALRGHVGVELMGNFETQRPSEAQLRSCVALVAWLCQEKHIDPSELAGHRDRAPGQTVCPGKDLYRYLQSGEFGRWVEDTLAGKTPAVKSGPLLANGPRVVVGTPPPAAKAAQAKP